MGRIQVFCRKTDYAANMYFWGLVLAEMLRILLRYLYNKLAYKNSGPCLSNRRFLKGFNAIHMEGFFTWTLKGKKVKPMPSEYAGAWELSSQALLQGISFNDPPP